MDVPVLNETGEIRGWRLITEPGKMHAAVAERNRQHLNQASPTPFGHRPGNDLLHGDDRHTTAKKVLRGDLEWQHPMEDVNNFIDNLAIAYDQEALETESRRINAVITQANFVSISRTKKRTQNRHHLGGT